MTVRLANERDDSFVNENTYRTSSPGFAMPSLLMLSDTIEYAETESFAVEMFSMTRGQAIVCPFG